MGTKLLAFTAGLSLIVAAANVDQAAASISIDLTYEFDGNSPGTSFGSVAIVDNSGVVDVTIVANTIALMGGDIHQLYFNLPDTITGLAISNSGGVSNRPINPFSIIGPDPSVAGGAGASFDWGVSFGNGGGPPGNGTLTTATFTLMADQPLDMSLFTAEASAPNNTPPVNVAVHFQGTDVFGATSETVGGSPNDPPPPNPHPEPISGIVWLGFLAIGLMQRGSHRN